MTTIDFYTGVADPLRLAARIVTKAWRTHGNVRVLTPDPAMTDVLDRLLWTEPQSSFVPHCRLASPIAPETPVWVDDADIALALIENWMEDYNTVHPHSRLGYRSPREYIATQSQPAACPVS